MNKLEESIVSLAQQDLADVQSHIGRRSFSIDDQQNLMAAREGALKLVMLALMDSGLGEAAREALQQVEKGINSAFNLINDNRQHDADPAYEAILFATNLGGPDGMSFLSLWREGDMDAVRAKWSDAPEGVFVGYDYFHTPSEDFKKTPRVPSKERE